jgi:enamine deaminase RidA (YjgF/YER057c/UK114 family)
MQASLRNIIGDQAVVFQERLFGPASARFAVLSARQQVYDAAGVKPAHSCTYVSGREDDDFGGLTGGAFWAVIPGVGTTVEPVSGHGEGPGLLLRSAAIDLLFVPCVSGGGRGDVTQQSSRMFRDAAQILAAHGFPYRKVVRTWIYLRRILDWYDEFNRVRTSFHKAHGILGNAEAPFAASTSIQGAVDSGECVMDVLAARVHDGANAQLRPLHRSRRQGRAMAYGSGFSRGMVMTLDGRRSVWVSGTASIDERGGSLHIGSRDAQVVETLLNVAALVETEGAGLRDVCSGIVYCKDAATYERYLEVVRLLDLEFLPLIPVLADLCREELLVEIEAVVAVPQGRVQ